MKQSTITPFDFDGARVRVLTDETGEPWFVADDVCKALGYANPRDAVANHVDEEDVARHYTLETRGGKQRALCVNESGIYALVFGSKLPSAKRFKHWVTKEVLPRLRRDGFYGGSGFPANATPLFAAEPCDHDTMWNGDFQRAMCRMYGQPFTPHRFPRWLHSPIGVLYRIMFGARAYRELKRLSPYKNDLVKHHQWFATEARIRLRYHVGAITMQALFSDTRGDFWARIRSSYGNVPLQLRIPGTLESAVDKPSGRDA